MERRIVYFEDRKPENTETTFQLVRERLNNFGIKKLVIASASGATALKAAEFFKDAGVKLIVVPHPFDFRTKVNPFPPELVKSQRFWSGRIL
jgi:uncharacterized protein